MNGNGCKACPVWPCETMRYRGSTCMAQRARLGLGDPMTNADRIRAMSDEELAAFLAERIVNQSVVSLKADGHEPTATDIFNISERLTRIFHAWLQQPAKEE